MSGNKLVGRLNGKCLTIGNQHGADMLEWGVCSGSRTLAIFAQAGIKAVSILATSSKELDVNMDGITFTIHSRRRILLEEFITSFLPNTKSFTMTYVAFDYKAETVLSPTRINVFQLMADMYLLDNYAASGWLRRPAHVYQRLVRAAATLWYVTGVKPTVDYASHDVAIRHEYARLRTLTL